MLCYICSVKTYIHARLGKHERTLLQELKNQTGCSDSDLVRRGLRLVLDELSQKQSALALAGASAGKFKKGPRDLAINPKHLEDFGR